MPFKYNKYAQVPEQKTYFTNRAMRLSIWMENKTYHVYAGHVFYPITVHKRMLGFKMGSFVNTKKHCIYKKEKKKKKFLK